MMASRKHKNLFATPLLHCSRCKQTGHRTYLTMETSCCWPRHLRARVLALLFPRINFVRLHLYPYMSGKRDRDLENWWMPVQPLLRHSPYNLWKVNNMDTSMIYIQFAVDLTHYAMIYVVCSLFTLIGIVKAIASKEYCSWNDVFMASRKMCI